MGVLPKRKGKLPMRVFEKLNIFPENEDIKWGYKLYILHERSIEGTWLW